MGINGPRRLMATSCVTSRCCTNNSLPKRRPAATSTARSCEFNSSIMAARAPLHVEREDLINLICGWIIWGYGWIWMDMDGYGWIWGYMDGYNGHLNLEIKRHLKSTGGWRFHITQYSHSPLERLWYSCVLSRPSFQPSALLWHARRVQRKAAETCKRKAKAENCHNKMHSTWQQLGLAFVSEKLPWHFLNQLSKQK